jgi:hypothetical protein
VISEEAFERLVTEVDIALESTAASGAVDSPIETASNSDGASLA